MHVYLHAYIQNHMVERIWVEVNTRINYPVKTALLNMVEQGAVSLDNEHHKFYVSWYTIKVLSVGVELFVNSWNNHPIPGMLPFSDPLLLLIMQCELKYTGRRRGGMPTHVPNRVMQSCSRMARIDLQHLPNVSSAVTLYIQEGGTISDGSQFGNDALEGYPRKIQIREQAFTEKYPSFEEIFHQLVNSNSTLFKEALRFYIDISYRLSCCDF